MPPPSSSCSTLLALAKTLQEKVKIVKEIKDRYVIEGKDDLLKDFEIAMKEAKSAKIVYKTETDRIITYRGKQARSIEVTFLEAMDNELTNAVGFDVDSKGKISLINVSSDEAPPQTLLTALRFIPFMRGLKGLNCSNNTLTSLPELPDGLVWLYCSNNTLTSLPELPDGLKELDCSNNPELAIIPELKDSLTYIDIRGTKAAKDDDVKKRLDEFKKKHQGVNTEY